MRRGRTLAELEAALPARLAAMTPEELRQVILSWALAEGMSQPRAEEIARKALATKGPARLGIASG